MCTLASTTVRPTDPPCLPVRASTKGAVSYQPGASPQVANRPTHRRSEGQIRRIPDCEVGHQLRGIRNTIRHAMGHAMGHQISHAMRRAFDLGRCPRLVWLRAFGPPILRLYDPPGRSSIARRRRAALTRNETSKDVTRCQTFESTSLARLYAQGGPLGGAHPIRTGTQCVRRFRPKTQLLLIQELYPLIP